MLQCSQCGCDLILVTTVVKTDLLKSLQHFIKIGLFYFGTRKAEVLNSLIINTTAKANDTTDILQTFR